MGHRHAITRTGETLVVTFTGNDDATFAVAFTDDGAADFAEDLLEAIDVSKVQISFRQAIEESDDMKPEDKAYWLSVCDREGV